jgi:hypothetical protein
MRPQSRVTLSKSRSMAAIASIRVHTSRKPRQSSICSDLESGRRAYAPALLKL